MPESVKDVVVRIIARKEGFESLDSATSDVKNFSNKVQEANTASASFADRLGKSAEGFEKLGRMGTTFMSVLDRIEISQLNVANAETTLASAQLRYNEAVQKYGESSREAFIASNELARAQNGVEAANLRANTSMVMVGVTMVGQIPAIVSFGRTMVTTLRGVELSTAAMSLRLKALAPELLILSAMAGGFIYLTQQARAAEDSMSSAFDSINTKASELRQTIEEIKGSLASAEERKMEAVLRLSATQKALSEAALSDDEKRRQNEEAILRYDEEILSIRLAGDKESLKTAKDKAAIYESMEDVMKRSAAIDLARKGDTSGFRGLRGATASPAAIGGVGLYSSGENGVSAGATGLTPLPAEYAISPYLKQAEKDTIQKVNVVEFLAQSKLAEAK